MNTVSISVRLQRTTTEEAFVSVLVTSDLIREQPDGSGRLDGAAVIARAVEMGQSEEVVWTQEERQVAPHLIQKSPYSESDTEHT